MQCVRSIAGAVSEGDRIYIVLGPLGEPRGAVPAAAGCDDPLLSGGKPAAECFLARCVRAAGLPERDAEGRPLRYALRRRGPRLVQLLPEVTAAATPRLRRLMADYQLIQNEFTGHPRVAVQPAGGYPPERYVVTYSIPGVQGVDAGGMPLISHRHVADIYLHSGYPREKPKAVLRTPIFHPNFGSYICIADHWAPGETLVDVIVHIGQMIQYQVYNPASPLNGIAAQWTRGHQHLLPVGREPLYQAEPDIQFGGEAPAREECASSDARGAESASEDADSSVAGASSAEGEDTIPLAPPDEDRPAKDGFTQLWFD